MSKAKPKKAYAKPGIVYRGKVEVLAAACTSAWTAGRTCRLQGQAACVKTRF